MVSNYEQQESLLKHFSHSSINLTSYCEAYLEC